MKIIKISALWCGACLITNKAWNELKKKYEFEAVDLDYDLDEEEIAKFSPGKVLPVFIFIKNNQETSRLVGEVSYEELEKELLEVKNSK